MTALEAKKISEYSRYIKRESMCAKTHFNFEFNVGFDFNPIMNDLLKLGYKCTVGTNVNNLYVGSITVYSTQ